MLNFECAIDVHTSMFLVFSRQPFYSMVVCINFRKCTYISNSRCTYSYKGVKKLKEERKCRFVKDGKRCRRFSRVEIYFPGTDHQRAINVGYCIGECNKTGQFAL